MAFKSYVKPGKGVSKEDLEKTGVELYLDIFFRRAWKMMTLNVLYLLVSIPAMIISLFISLYFFTLAANLKNISVEENVLSVVLLSFALAFVFFQVTGSGPASVAKTYVLRKYVNDRHSWPVSEFFENIKRNFKQGLLVYFINIIAISALLFSSLFYSTVIKSSILSIGAICVLAIFTMMQFYVYQLVASMELKTKHIYKNALVLTLIKLPWNVLVAAVTFAFMYILYYLTFKITSIAVILILAIYFAIVTFTQIFMTNNIINKYVIEPSLAEIDKEETSEI